MALLAARTAIFPFPMAVASLQGCEPVPNPAARPCQSLCAARSFLVLGLLLSSPGRSALLALLRRTPSLYVPSKLPGPCASLSRPPASNSSILVIEEQSPRSASSPRLFASCAQHAIVFVFLVSQRALALAILCSTSLTSFALPVILAATRREALMWWCA
jgi:hypothetical protein|uniref:Uncharacterized protein n=1 Tax=Zea mays TaxID=4577 RepID=A0A804Q740_MAIZE